MAGMLSVRHIDRNNSGDMDRVPWDSEDMKLNEMLATSYNNNDQRTQSVVVGCLHRLFGRLAWIGVLVQFPVLSRLR